MNRYSTKTALVTGANSGLGFEAAAQLAEQGFGRVILATRTLEKGEDARRRLIERVGRDLFETVAIDVSLVASAEAASAELLRRGVQIDALLLNAGMVAGSLRKTAEGVEEAFAASLIGHHVLTTRLLEGGALNQDARIVIAGSEAGNGNLPAMFGMQPYDFALGQPTAFGSELREAMLNFARVAKPELFDPTRYYAVTKAFSAWWAAAMARRYAGRVSVFNVSPGASMGTNAARHSKGFKRLLFTKVMPLFGNVLGVDQPVPVAAKRYIDVLLGGDRFVSGATYTSAPKKMVGPIERATYAHLVDEQRQELAYSVLGELSGVGVEEPVRLAV